jgi:hypothetical protein
LYNEDYATFPAGNVGAGDRTYNRSLYEVSHSTPFLYVRGRKRAFKQLYILVEPCGIIMTLVLTELSNFGIAMAADTALTVSCSSGTRVYYGTRKLLKIPKLNAGISWWGEATVNKIETDSWLYNFINDNEKKYNSLAEFAILLQDELRRYVLPIDVNKYPGGTRGFHLAGFVEYKKQKQPAFYHIHNGESTATDKKIKPQIINANFDCPPIKFLQLQRQKKTYMTRNGDYEPYAVVSNMLKALVHEYFPKFNIQVPYPPSLEARTKYLRFQIKMMSELYKISDRIPCIGGEITTLAISSNGIEKYENY